MCLCGEVFKEKEGEGRYVHVVSHARYSHVKWEGSGDINIPKFVTLPKSGKDQSDDSTASVYNTLYYFITRQIILS